MREIRSKGCPAVSGLRFGELQEPLEPDPGDTGGGIGTSLTGLSPPLRIQTPSEDALR